MVEPHEARAAAYCLSIIVPTLLGIVALAVSRLAPATDAASNKMSYQYGQKYYTLKLDSKNINATFLQSEVKKDKTLTALANKALPRAQQSSEPSEAFGSSHGHDAARMNDALAIQACLQGKDFQSTPMDEGKKAGIIIGFVLGIFGLLGGIVQQAGLFR